MIRYRCAVAVHARGPRLMASGCPPMDSSAGRRLGALAAHLRERGGRGPPPAAPAAAAAGAGLSEAQRAHFQAFGFLHLRACYSAAEVGLLTEECERVLAAIDAQGEARAEGGLSGPSGRNAQKFIEESALLTRYLVEDQRVFAPAAELLRGEDFIWSTSNHIMASPAGPEFEHGGAPRREHGWVRAPPAAVPRPQAS